MKKHLALAVSILFCLSANAQNIKDADIEYVNVKLPLLPLPASIKNYQSAIIPAYEEKNKLLLAEYEKNKMIAQDVYDKAMAEYPALVKAAEDKYAKELEVYNKKSLGTKIVERNLLGENNKPVKNIPSKPYLGYVEKPVLQRSYDYPVLASTYIHLDNFENNPANAVKINVTLYGYDFTQPRVLSTQKNMLSISGGSTSTYNANYYYVEYSCRQPMSVKVIAPDGKELLSVTPQPLNVYKTYKSGETEKMPQVNNESLVRTTEEKLLQENLQYINKLVNEKFGFFRETRKSVLYFVKSKSDEYTDLLTAFNEASSGLRVLADDSATAKPQLTHAIDTWNNALKESDLANKKARIDKDLTIVIIFNLLEVNLATRNYTAGMQLIQQLNSISISNKERSIKTKYEMDFADLKKRLAIN